MRAVVAVLLASIALGAQAQEDDAAKTTFEAGVKELEAKNYAAAVVAFERSLALKESLPTLFNLAVAYRGVGRYRDAQAKLDTFVLGLERTDAPPDALQRARALRDEVTKKLARIYIETSGGAQAVMLDELTIAKSDGKKMIDVDPGTYMVRVRREGFETIEVKVNAAEGQSYTLALDAAKKPLTSRVVIRTVPLTAEIRIDEHLAAVGHFDGPLSFGKHWIEVVAPDHETQLREVLVEREAELSLAVALEREERALTSEWWFWTGIVAVVAAGTVTTIAIANRTPAQSCGSTGVCLFGD
jgi:hypothetical protein